MLKWFININVFFFFTFITILKPLTEVGLPYVCGCNYLFDLGAVSKITYCNDTKINKLLLPL